MSIIQVVFQKYGGIPETRSIALDINLGDFLKAAQTQLNLREPCQLVLDRTGETLSESLTFGDAGIKQNDKLIVVPRSVLQEFQSFSSSSPEIANKNNKNLKETTSSFKVRYTLQLQIAGEHKSDPELPEHSIDLEEFYENNPERFFSDFNGWNKQKFETFLKQTVPRELEKSDIDQILEEWCDDISFGYKKTTVEI